MALTRLQTGTRIKSLDGKTWNAFCDTAEWANRQQKIGSTPGETAVRNTGVVRVKNETGTDLTRYSVVALVDVLFTHTENANGFLSYPYMSAVIPQEPDHLGRFGVCLDPMLNGAFGAVAVSGIVPVLITSDSTELNYEYADISDDNITGLRACAAGGARIMYRESAGAPYWALVKLDAGAQEFQPFGAELVFSGSPGSESPKLWIRAGSVLAADGSGDVSEYLETPIASSWYWVEYTLKHNHSAPTITATIQTDTSEPDWIDSSDPDNIVYKFQICSTDSSGRLTVLWRGGNINAPQITESAGSTGASGATGATGATGSGSTGSTGSGSTGSTGATLNLTSITGYNASNNQVIVNNAGTISWVDLAVFECPGGT